MEEFYPFQVNSLVDMLHKFAFAFYHIGETLGSIRITSDLSSTDGQLSEELLGEALEKLDITRNWCERINLTMSVLGADRAKREICENPTFDQVKRSIGELHNRISDEIHSNLLMYLTPEQVEWYRKQDAFGEEVAKKFSSANFDIDEACKCYAFGRYTACVMHLMRVLEIGMKALADELGVPLTVPSWDGILGKIDNQLELKRNQRDPEFLANEEFYGDAARHIRTYQRARNRTQHPDKKYTPEEAKRIFEAVGELMEHLAKNLDDIPMPENLRVTSTTATSVTLAWDEGVPKPKRKSK